ncbi:hypothetical protein FC62_GL000407 [Amylolactobacillus amylotrophicus DSM 20534]|uniref:VanZ family protein n=3 Tax=Amylolactobacillus TaxID=2767876 RepID=A0A1L6XDG7_9LACO|nr:MULTISPECIES: VanZ family protein [Amylolactobacillus]APT19018.1 VanZ family protein [Amylolactobacillus amylophilus DSM 20533 = JCM 1125]KRK38718.1 hypothetical protein FC62_GL000407 [Amylolactobacillus amylotrophicus DSM 20534]KRM42639.1 hypothetical protein FD40_GL000432 [Amylolactobacillus amylophilus DSM 20533 = JCM 1125]GED79936.1 glycopeptide antibiotics resistance protein [Amylolactobacillus amylophilus]
MIFLQPFYQFVVTHYSNSINHFPLVKLVFFSVDKTLFYFLIFAVIRLIWLLAVKERRKIWSELAVWLFVFYIMLLLALTVFRGTYFPWQLRFYFDRPLTQINFNFLSETLKLTRGASLLDFIYNLFGNIFWFVPFGFLFPQVFRWFNRAWRTILAGGLFSLLIESLQLVLYTGVSDLDDVFFNLIGTLIGYVLFALTVKKRSNLS